jgi:putative endonuclease
VVCSGDTLRTAWSLYLIRCSDGSLYTGVTTDVERRFREHCKGTGAKYLRGRGPLTLEFHCRVGNRSDALRLEHLVKRLDKMQKEALLKETVSNPEALRLFFAGRSG